MERLIHRLRDSQTLAKIVGAAPAFLNAIAKLPAIAKSEATVLISGETGTGKELVARAIHYLSNRDSFPFVALNCGSLAETLMEAEIFGHERGAFTDARARRPGLIAQAELGTLFLDEVDSLPAKAQVGLLRVLQDKRFRMVGSSVEQNADVRIVAATNARLDDLVRSGLFRADLYYRLSVFLISLPPLRYRKEDIPSLADHFLKKHAPTGRATLHLCADAVAALISCDWPGNVRELENAIIRGIHLSETDLISADDLVLKLPSRALEIPAGSLGFNAAKRKVVDAFEREYLSQLMSRHDGNISRAAVAAGKERRDLGKLLKKYRLDPKVFHSAPPHRSDDEQGRVEISAPGG